MANDFAYLTILFLDFVYLIVLLYGGVWYTDQRTIKCPRCGVKYSKFRIGGHECHPSLVDDRDDEK